MSSKEPVLSPHASELKAQADKHFKLGDFSKAFKKYTAVITEELRSPAIYSNRSATAVKLKKFAQALKDAEKAVQVRTCFLSDPVYHY